MDELRHPGPTTPSGMADLVDELVRDCLDPVSPGAMDRLTAVPRIRAMYAAIVEAFPDARFSTLWRVVEGRRAALGGVVSGTHLGTWRDVAATARRIELLTTVMVEVADGAVVDLMVVTDSLALAEQIGLLEPVGPKACELPSPSDDGSATRTACGDALLTRLSGRAWCPAR